LGRPRCERILQITAGYRVIERPEMAGKRPMQPASNFPVSGRSRRPRSICPQAVRGEHRCALRNANRLFAWSQGRKRYGALSSSRDTFAKELDSSQCYISACSRRSPATSRRHGQHAMAGAEARSPLLSGVARGRPSTLSHYFGPAPYLRGRLPSMLSPSICDRRVTRRDILEALVEN